MQAVSRAVFVAVMLVLVAGSAPGIAAEDDASEPGSSIASEAWAQAHPESLAAKSLAADIVFVDGNRARVDPEYRVQLGMPDEEGACVRDDMMVIDVGHPADEPSTSAGPGLLEYNVATVGFQETDTLCQYDVETHDYSGPDALLWLAAQGWTP